MTHLMTWEGMDLWMTMISPQREIMDFRASSLRLEGLGIEMIEVFADIPFIFVFRLIHNVFQAPLEKLTSLIEDIFEAEDALPADISPSDLPAEWFSPMSTDGASPLLHPNRIRKLAKYIGQITRPTKRIRLSESTVGSGGTPKGKGRITEVDIGILGRIMKILERSVKSGEDLDPFHYVAVTREKSASPRKKKTAKRPKANEDEGAKGEGPEEADVVMEEPVPPPPEVTDSDLENLTRLMDVAKDSVLAADCCIALLGSDRLNKQVCECLSVACFQLLIFSF